MSCQLNSQELGLQPRKFDLKAGVLEIGYLSQIGNAPNNPVSITNCEAKASPPNVVPTQTQELGLQPRMFDLKAGVFEIGYLPQIGNAPNNPVSITNCEAKASPPNVEATQTQELGLQPRMFDLKAGVLEIGYLSQIGNAPNNPVSITNCEAKASPPNVVPTQLPGAGASVPDVLSQSRCIRDWLLISDRQCTKQFAFDNKLRG